MAHGLDAAAAQAKVASTYCQLWARDGTDAWTVSTSVMDASGAQTVSRSITYPLGDWSESFVGGSALFGAAPGVVTRNTSWVAYKAGDTGVRPIPTQPRRLPQGSASQSLECVRN